MVHTRASEIIRDTGASVTLDELIAAFLVANQHTFLANTHRAYRSDLALFARSVPDLPAQEVTADHLRVFLAATADLAPTTVARRQAALRPCFSWAFRNDLLRNGPSARLEKVTLPVREPRPLTDQQVAALLVAIPPAHHRNRLLFTLLAETGMRVGEALALDRAHVHLNDTDGGYLQIVGKGDRERITPLIDAPRSLRLLRSLLKREGAIGPLFSGAIAKGGRTSEPVDYTTVLYHFARYLAAARRNQPALFAAEGGPITIHRLRHTYATGRLRAGVSLPVVRQLLGHQTLQSTLRYTDLDLETVKAELVAARRCQAGR
jgi:integrase/recombinase XerD